MFIVTGATGKFGHHAIDLLLKKVPAKEVTVAVRNVEKANNFAARGVTVKRLDYDHPETAASALQGGNRLLLVSASEVGKRATQHRAVIDGAKKAGISLIAYTSILRCNTSKLGLAAEHKATEEMIRSSGIPYVFLRNSWYLENYTEHLDAALASGAINGSAGSGKVAAATREDYAAAAVEVLTGTGHENKSYELGGDLPFTIAELAAEVARQSKKPVVYNDLPAEQYQALLTRFGLPPPVVELFVDSDLGIAKGELDTQSKDLSRLIGRPTTSLAAAVKVGLKLG